MGAAFFLGYPRCVSHIYLFCRPTKVGETDSMIVWHPRQKPCALSPFITTVVGGDLRAGVDVMPSNTRNVKNKSESVGGGETETIHRNNQKTKQNS